MTKKYVIGLNSGTSFDGIDVALVKFTRNLKPIFIDGLVYKYPRSIKERIRQLIDIKTHSYTSLQKISQLNFLLGEIFANAALKIIRKNKLAPKNILLIASHGQTIFHKGGKSTFQIGESSIIAQKAGIKTISNFREGDIAAGGQGAPLMSYLDWVVFGRGTSLRAILNIGGISNITIVGKNITPIAFDIGPGNALIDLLTKQYFKKDFDKDGEIAKKGKVYLNLVEKALKDPYFKKKPPKSTGKEYFNERFIKKYFPVGTCCSKSLQSLIATVTYFSAKCIEKALRDFVFPKYKIDEVVMSGGGVRNKILIKHLRQLFAVEACHSTSLLTISDKYGLPWKYKEAILFALLGYTCHLGKTNNIPSCTGAKKKVILGKMTKVR